MLGMQRASFLGILETGLRLTSETFGSCKSLGQMLVGRDSMEGGPVGLLRSLKTAKSGLE